MNSKRFTPSPAIDLGLALVCAMLAMGPAVAGQPIDETRPLRADGQLEVSNVAGSIRVSTWDRNEVHISGELGEGAEELAIEGDAGKLQVEVRMPRNARHLEDTLLDLKVPATAMLKLASVSADIDVEGLRGDLAANSVSGDLALRVDSRALNLRSVSGNIQLDAPAQRCSLNTVSGDVFAKRLSGQLQLETVSGDIQLEGGAFDKADFKSISGDFRLRMAVNKNARITGETLSGELELNLPRDTSAQVQMHSFSGDLRSGFDAASDAAREGDKRLDFRLGDGSARIDLSSFSGDISLQAR